MSVASCLASMKSFCHVLVGDVKRRMQLPLLPPLMVQAWAAVELQWRE
jgi:hypothetical protein